MRLLFILCVLCLPFASGCACLVDALLDDGCHHHHHACGSYTYRYDPSCAPRPRHCR